MDKPKHPKILVFDIEAAGVQGLKADRSFVVCFGFKWLGQKKATVLTILDYPGKDCQDDTPLLRAASEILSEAEGLIAHFGENYDRPFLEARLRRAGLSPIPNAKLTDTCLVARRKFCLSSNRLGNLADFLNVKTKKMDKRGGWPLWWMQALRGDPKGIKDMAAYCAVDVECLEQIYLKMRPIISTRFLPINAAIGQTLWTCHACGGHRKQHRGYYWSEKKRWRRYQCQGCGRWDHASKAEAAVPQA